MAGFDTDQAQIAQQQRRAQLAQMLLQQGMQQEPTQMAGPIAIRQSPLSGLVKGLMGYQGIKGLNETDSAITDITQRREQTDNEAIQKGMQLLNSGDQQGAMTAFSASPKGQAYAAEILKSKLPKPEETPADQRIFQWLQTQPQEVQDAYKNYKQVGQKPETPYYTAQPTSAGVMIFNNRTGKYEMATDPGVGAALPPNGALPPGPGMPNAPAPRLLPVAADPQVQGAVEQAKAQGKTTGEATGTAKVQYGTMANSIDEIDRDIGRLREHPGLSGIVGLRGAIPNIPGSDAANAQAQLEKLQGGVFLQARAALKGGGQITDYEGMKAEQAYGRMQKAQSKEALLEALDDYQTHIKKGLQLLNQQGQGNFSAVSGSGAQMPGNSALGGTGRFQVEVMP